MRIYFVRHGESEANLLHIFSNRGEKYGLTDNGIHDSYLLAEKFKDTSVSKIFSSPLIRAIQTTRILSNELGIPFETVEALREYDCGVLEGKSDEESWKQYDHISRDWLNGRWESRIKDGENLLNIKERFVPFIEKLIHEYNDLPAKLILVSHRGIYRHMLPLILNNIDPLFPFKHPIDYTGIVVAESQINHLVCIKWNKMILG